MADAGQKRRLWKVLIVMGAVLFILAAGQARAEEPKVVINEVMWMGSLGANGESQADDEWIELKNTTESAIDLTGWTADNLGSGTTMFKLSGTIAPKDFFLVSNFAADKSAMKDGIAAEMVATAVSLNNSGEQLVLRDKDRTEIDKTPAVSWAAGADRQPAARQSMERGEDGNWHTNTDEAASAPFWDEAGKNFGTPRAANSAPKSNQPPVAAISGPATGVIGQTLAFSAEDSSDADGEELKYSWDLGNGEKASGATVAVKYAAAGLYEIVVTVSDGKESGTASLKVTVIAPNYLSTVVINEFLPNPAGDDAEGEFIELKNTGEEAVDLSGWKLDDADGGSQPFTWPAGSLIAARALQVWERKTTGITLNNDKDSVRLLTPTGTLAAEAVYSASAPEGQSHNRTADGEYALSTTVTKGEENVITAPAAKADEEKEEDQPAAKKAEKPAVKGVRAEKLSLKDAARAEIGALVTVEGVVTAPAGVAEKRMICLGAPALPVWLGKGVLDKWIIGDRLSATGKVTKEGEGRKVNVSEASQLKKTGRTDPLLPRPAATGGLKDGLLCEVVSVRGVVASSSGDTFIIDDGSGELTVTVKTETGIKKPKLKKGMRVAVTGIVSNTKKGARILPRATEDILVEGEAPAATAAAKKAANKKAPVKKSVLECPTPAVCSPAATVCPAVSAPACPAAEPKQKPPRVEMAVAAGAIAWSVLQAARAAGEPLITRN